MENKTESNAGGSKYWRSKIGPLYGLLVAAQFLTRLPVPKNLNPTKEEFGACAPWYPVVGLIVGGILAVAAWGVLSLPLAPGIAAILLLVLGTLLTGAFHEDGLADTVDGMGGGWTKESILRIMRDSRIGSYGALAVVFLILIRVTSLWGTEPAYWPHALIVAHVLSRWSILPLMKFMPYARADQPGLGKPIVESITSGGLLVSTLGVAFFCIAIAGGVGLISMIVASVTAFIMGRFFKKRIGGMTGDCLGAVNVLCEVAVLILFALNHGTTLSPWIAP